jgi:hypothetical protein
MNRSPGRRFFDPAALDALRSMTPQQTLDRLGLGWKRDPDFSPTKNPATVRLHVAVGAGVVELVVTGARWYDPRAKKGGGGAIDLTMHLLGLPFVDAVKRLS